jgi:glucans biosynthesis protein C
MQTRRLHYVDWLRVLAVLLLFPFHTARVFNAGEPFYVKAPHLSRPLGWALGFIDVWHMPLLFFLAGASTYFALRRRTRSGYARERFRRLLVPLLFGWVVLIPPQTWYGARFNSGYSGSFFHYLVSGDFLENNIRDGGDYYGGFGIGHLWFILFLLVISLVVLPLWGERARGAVERMARVLSHPAGWLLAAFLIMIAEGLPDLAGKNIVYYLVFFVSGYLMMVAPRFEERAERHGWWALPAGFALAAWWVAIGDYRDSLPDPSLILTMINMAGFGSAWLVIVGSMGLGRRYLDRRSAALDYLAEGSYPIYILHQTVIVVLGFWLVKMNLPWAAQWIALLTAATAATFLLYAGLRRVGWLRALFGMRPLPRPNPVPVTEKPPTEARSDQREPARF